MEWFKHEHLTRTFDSSVHTGIHGLRQVDVLLNFVRNDRPTFALINFGETHDPYEIGRDGRVADPETSRARKPTLLRKGAIDHIAWQRQGECCDFIDKCLQAIHAQLMPSSRNTIFILCGDHGECFGEDGNFGHGFYHPKTMEVPLAIFDLFGELTTTVREAAT